SRAACLFGGLRERDSLGSGERGNGSHDRRLAAQGRCERFEDFHFLVEGERSSLAKRSESDDTRAAIGHEPVRVRRHKSVIHFVRLGKTCCDGGHDTGPFHCDAPCVLKRSDFVKVFWRLEQLTGKSGGRGKPTPHPKRNSAALPQMRPWQGPIPQRVCNLAARQESIVRTLPKSTSSQRQRIVSSRAMDFSSSHKAKARAIARTLRRATLRRRNLFFAAAN